MAAPIDEKGCAEKPRRERKPNFSDAEILVILEGVYENRKVLNQGENGSGVNKQKEAIYRQITESVNKVTLEEYGGSVLRTAKEVKKKWIELKSTSIRVYNAKINVAAGLKPDKYVPKESPHTQLVLDILAGNVKKWPTQTGIGINASNRHSPGRQSDNSSDISGSLQSLSSADCLKETSRISGEAETGSGFNLDAQPAIKTELMDENSTSFETDQQHLSDLSSALFLIPSTSAIKENLLNGNDAKMATRNRSPLHNRSHSVKIIKLPVHWLARRGAHNACFRMRRMWTDLKCAARKGRQTIRAAETEGRNSSQRSHIGQVAAAGMVSGSGSNLEESNITEVQEVDFDAMMNLEASGSQEMQPAGQRDVEFDHTVLQWQPPLPRARKANFSPAETTCLLQEVLKHMKVLRGDYDKSQQLEANLAKRRTWRIIADRVSRVSQSGESRSVSEVQRKYRRLRLAMLEAKKSGRFSDGIARSRHDQLTLQALDAEEKAVSAIVDFNTIKLEDQESVQSSFPAHLLRNRKYNFTISESECLIDEIDENKHILLRSPSGDTVPMAERRQVWQLVADRVNRKVQQVSQLCPRSRRTPLDVHKRWLAMKRSAMIYHQALAEGNAVDFYQPLLFHRIMNILQATGNVELCSQDQLEAEGDSLHNFSNHDELDSGELIDKISQTAGAVSDRISSIIEQGQIQNIADGENSVDTGEVDVYVDVDDNIDNSAEEKKRNRKANFTHGEVKCLLDMYETHKAILSKQGDMATNARKQHIWQIIADRVSEVEKGGSRRTAQGMKKKWKAIKSTVVAAWVIRQKALSEGRQLPKKVPFMQQVLRIIGEPGGRRRGKYSKREVEHTQDESEEIKKEPAAGVRPTESVSALVLRHMKALADICKDLKSHGIDAGVFILEKDSVLSCGTPVVRNLLGLPDVLRTLYECDIDSSQTHSGSADELDWEVTALDSTTDNTRHEENHIHTDRNCKQDLLTSGLEEEPVVSSDLGNIVPKVQDNEHLQMDGNMMNDETTVGDNRDVGVSIASNLTDDADSVINIKDKLKRMLHSRSRSTDGEAPQETESEEGGSSSDPESTEESFVTADKDGHQGTSQTCVEQKPYECCNTLCAASFSTLTSLIIHNREHKGEQAVFSSDASDMDVNHGSAPVRSMQLQNSQSKASAILPAIKKNPIVLLKKLPHSMVSTAIRGSEHPPPMSVIRNFSCSGCGHRFASMDQLTKHAQLMHQSMPALSVSARERRFSCCVCGKRFLKGNHLQTHMRLHTGEKPYSCHICNATFTQRGGLTLHVKSRHPLPASQLGLKIGEESTDSHEVGFDLGSFTGDDLNDDRGDDVDDDSCLMTSNIDDGELQLRAHDADQGTSESQDDFVDLRQRRYGCETCGKQFFTSSHLRQHVRIHTGERPFKCDVCGFGFTQATSLTVHRRKHTGERPYACDLCGYKFYCSSDVLSHKRKRHGLSINKPQAREDKYRCDLCGKVFPDTTRLKVHQRKHSGEKPFSCDECGRSFSEKHNLLRHKERHLGIKAFQCEVCGAKFTEKGNLKVHMRYHTGDKPFKCEFCGEGFYVTSTLKIHRRKHTGERPFLCDLCGASFTQGTKLRSHRRKHTGEKPYQCDECGEHFKEKQQLNIHQRKHTGEQPYRCSVCGKAAQKASHLAVHMRLHTGERPFHCEVCGEKFARSDVLKLHMKKHGAGSRSSGQGPSHPLLPGQEPQMVLIPPTMVPPPNMIPLSFQ